MEPLLVINPRSGSGSPDAETLATDLPLLADPHSRVVVLTDSAAELDKCAAQVSYLRPPLGEELNLATMLARLRAEHGVRRVRERPVLPARAVGIDQPAPDHVTRSALPKWAVQDQGAAQARRS